MRKEFGKWLMDIAKYVTTAILLSAIFVDIKDHRGIFIFVCAVTILVCLVWGLYLIKDKSVENTNTNTNIKKGGKK